MRGLGVASMWHVAGEGMQRHALSLKLGDHTWLGPVIELPAGDCGAGHCVDVEVEPVLRTIHPGHRAAAVVELKIHPAGTPRCSSFDGSDELCTVKVADDGAITRTCHVELGD